jgi:8-oxo-dGTP diphosphatase
MATPTIRVVAAALIHNDRLLVARRGPQQSQAGLWELPGGKVELGETDQQALTREIAEELGLEIEAHEILGENRHDYGAKVVVLVAIRASLIAGDLVLREHSEARWAQADDLDGLEWAPADVPLLTGVRAALAGPKP